MFFKRNSSKQALQYQNVAQKAAESFLHSLVSSVLWRGLDRATGFLKHILIAAAVGLSTQLDVFYMVLALLGVLVFSWATLFDVLAMPEMVRAWKDNATAEYRHLASGMFVLSLLLSLCLVLMVCFFSPYLSMSAMGFDEEKKALMSEALWWLLPVIALFVPMHLLEALLRSQRRFSLAYQADFIVPLVILICVAFFPTNPYVLLWSYSLGVVCAFVFLLSVCFTTVFPLKNPFCVLIFKPLKMAPALMLFQVAAYLLILADRTFVSFLSEGSVSAMSYAFTLVLLLPTILSFASSYIIVAAEKNEPAERSQQFNELISLTIFIGVVSTVGFLLLREPLVALLLERGMFTAQDTHKVAEALAGYVGLIIPLFLVPVVNQVFQVEGKINMILWRTLLTVLIHVSLCYVFIFVFSWGLLSIALALSIANWILLLLGISALGQLGYKLAIASHARWLAWNVMVMSIPAGIFYYLSAYWQSHVGHIILAVLLLCPFLWFAGHFYRGNERQLFAATVARLLRRGQPS